MYSRTQKQEEIHIQKQIKGWKVMITQAAQAAVQKLNSPIILPGVKKIHKEKELSISPYVIICATLIVFISADGQLLRIVGWHYFLLFHKGWSSVSSISGDII